MWLKFIYASKIGPDYNFKELDRDNANLMILFLSDTIVKGGHNIYAIFVWRPMFEYWPIHETLNTFITGKLSGHLGDATGEWMGWDVDGVVFDWAAKNNWSPIEWLNVTWIITGGIVGERIHEINQIQILIYGPISISCVFNQIWMEFGFRYNSISEIIILYNFLNVG